MNNLKSFILFDDDPVNNMLSKITIIKTLKEAEILTFRSAEKGFHHIKTEYEKKDKKGVIILLDINMPGMNCWEFLEKFQQLNEEVRNKFRIYIISASYKPVDKELASSNKNIAGWFEKPLTGEIIKSLIDVN